MKHLLAPVDFSDVTGRVIETAITLARALQADVTLVHVAPPEPDFIGYEPGPQSVRDRVARQAHEEHRRLAELEKRVAAAGIPCKALLVQGYAVEKILKEAAQVGADLIILGSHGHGAMHSLLVGSVTDGVLRKATQPVLVVPSQAT